MSCADRNTPRVRARGSVSDSSTESGTGIFSFYTFYFGHHGHSHQSLGTQLNFSQPGHHSSGSTAVYSTVNTTHRGREGSEKICELIDHCREQPCQRRRRLGACARNLLAAGKATKQIPQTQVAAVLTHDEPNDRCDESEKCEGFPVRLHTIDTRTSAEHSLKRLNISLPIQDMPYSATTTYSAEAWVGVTRSRLTVLFVASSLKYVRMLWTAIICQQTHAFGHPWG